MRDREANAISTLRADSRVWWSETFPNNKFLTREAMCTRPSTTLIIKKRSKKAKPRTRYCRIFWVERSAIESSWKGKIKSAGSK
jgi:hypothetical protein